MSTVAIICLGNRYVADDAVGCRVHDHLRELELPPDVELVDGGLCGLDLLRVIEGRHRVVFVDAVSDPSCTGEIVLLSGEQVAAYAGRYGHGAGLPYLLRMLPKVCESPLPEIVLVGTSGVAKNATVAALAKCSLEVASNGAC